MRVDTSKSSIVGNQAGEITIELVSSDSEISNDGIRGIYPPIDVDTLHVSTVELSLEVNPTPSIKGQKIPFESTNGHEALGISLRSSDQTSATSGSVTPSSMCNAAVDDFLCWRPSQKTVICHDRRFRSCRLNELAPGVFLPGFPRLVRSRQRLMPKLATVLAAHIKMESNQQIEDETFDPNAGKMRTVAQIQTNLWTSMVSGLRYSHLRSAQQIHTQKTKSQVGIHTQVEELPSQELDGGLIQQCMELSTSNPVYNEPRLQLNETQQNNAGSIVGYQVGGDYDQMNTTTSTYPHSANMDARHSAQQIGLEYGLDSKHHGKTNLCEEDGLDELSTAEMDKSFLTHHDRNSNASGLVLLDDHCEGLIGGSMLSQSWHSTKQHSRFEVSMGYGTNQDILMLDELQPGEMFSIAQALDTQLAPPTFSASHHDVLSSPTIPPTSTPVMADKESRYSLADVLGDDHFMWRRGSLAPIQDMHHLYENDPDMKLLTSTVDEYAFDDSMLFGSFDWSRNTSQSADSSETVSPDLTEEPPNLPNEIKHAPQEPTQLAKPSSKPIRPKTKRRPSVLQKMARPPRMSEDDIMYQQSSPTRDVDIKKRKSLTS